MLIDSYKDLEVQRFDFWTSLSAGKSMEPQGTSSSTSLLERSSISLSQWSLEMCTENLGSETGSDEFCPGLETDMSYAGIGKDEGVDRNKRGDEVDFAVAKFNKKPPLRSFPPPIFTLNNEHGASLVIQTHRDNGKLVVEAVSVTNKYSFRTERQHGRLVLSLVGSISDEDEAEMDTSKSVPKTQRDENHGRTMINPPLIFPRTLKLNTISIRLKNTRVITNQNPNWVYSEVEVEDDDVSVKSVRKIARSYRSRHARNQSSMRKEEKALQQGCKEPKRLLSVLVPRCIATS